MGIKSVCRSVSGSIRWRASTMAPIGSLSRNSVRQAMCAESAATTASSLGGDAPLKDGGTLFDLLKGYKRTCQPIILISKSGIAWSKLRNQSKGGRGVRQYLQ
jgi:hypothetical protein